MGVTLGFQLQITTLTHNQKHETFRSFGSFWVLPPWHIYTCFRSRFSWNSRWIRSWQQGLHAKWVQALHPWEISPLLEQAATRWGRFIILLPCTTPGTVVILPATERALSIIIPSSQVLLPCSSFRPLCPQALHSPDRHDQKDPPRPTLSDGLGTIWLRFWFVLWFKLCFRKCTWLGGFLDPLVCPQPVQAARILSIRPIPTTLCWALPNVPVVRRRLQPLSRVWISTLVPFLRRWLPVVVVTQMTTRVPYIKKLELSRCHDQGVERTQKTPKLNQRPDINW